MDRPFIIWTLRRTGGTTLAALFEQASSHTAIQHEPFNPDRVHGSIVKNWRESFSTHEMQRRVAQILDGSPVIKHCYEVVPMQLNVCLLQESIKRGYEQIVLRRRSEVNRLFSLEVAELTGAWGKEQAVIIYAEIKNGGRSKINLPIKKSILHMTECFLRTIWLSESFRALKIAQGEIFFEDLFSDNLMGIDTVNSILRRLGHSEEKISGLNKAVQHALTDRGQGSQKIQELVANNSAWQDAIKNAWEILCFPDTALDVTTPYSVAAQV